MKNSTYAIKYSLSKLPYPDLPVLNEQKRGIFMGTCHPLPAPDVCKIEKFISSADYWSCLVEDPAPCQYVVIIGTVRICSMASKNGTWLKNKIEGKKIVVRYANDSLEVVSQATLDELIESGKITAFKRSSGWVDIVNDPIRKESSHLRFNGLQRRAGRKITDQHYNKK